jgi:hypothetical protein
VSEAREWKLEDEIDARGLRRKARVLFISEGPFGGPAGDILTKLIAATGIMREDVRIIDMAGGLFFKQLSAILPEVIVTLGQFPAHALLNTKTPITRMRGKWFEIHGIPLLPTFHPAYLLRTPQAQVLAFDDVGKVAARVGQDATGKTIIREDHYRWGILDVCEQLHGEFTGSHDGWMTEDLAARIEWLRYRLENWTPSHLHTATFDDAVRALCTIALYEGEKAALRNQ